MALTQKKLVKFWGTVLEKRPYNLDISPCDFHIFGPLKKAIKDLIFYCDSEVMGNVPKPILISTKELL